MTSEKHAEDATVILSNGWGIAVPFDCQANIDGIRALLDGSAQGMVRFKRCELIPASMWGASQYFYALNGTEAVAVRPEDVSAVRYEEGHFRGRLCRKTFRRHAGGAAGATRWRRPASPR